MTFERVIFAKIKQKKIAKHIKKSLEWAELNEKFLHATRLIWVKKGGVKMDEIISV